MFDPQKKITVFAGKNGTGKTSIMEAIIYALTNNSPSNPIRFGEKDMFVETNLGVFSFQRIQTVGKPSKFKLNGKTSTAKVISEELSNLSGVPENAMKIATSSEVVKNMNSGELGDFLMQYVPDKLTLKDILDLFPAAYKDMESKDIDNAKKELEEDFVGIPEPYSIDTVKEVFQTVFDKRKYLKKTIADKEALIKSLPDNVTGRSLTDVQRDLEQVIKQEGALKASKIAMENYEKSVADRKKQEEKIAQLESAIISMTVAKPNERMFEQKTAERDAANKQILNAENSKKVMQNNLSILSLSLENIKKPVCPLSDQICCTVDKTGVIKEISESISDTRKGIADLDNLLISLRKNKEDKEKEINKLHDERVQYSKKIEMIAQKNYLEKNMPTIGKKPDEVKEEDFSDVKKALYHEKEAIEASVRKEKEMVVLENLHYSLKLNNFLVDVLGAKGEVMSKIVAKYLTIFEDICNDRAKKISQDFEIRFVAEDGIQIECRPAAGKPFLPFENLSGGERACVIFLIMDMINMLTGLKILLIDGDDIGTMDEEVLNSFFTLLIDNNYQDDYDHIIINVLDNEKTMKFLGNQKDVDVTKL